jgi:adenine-specific DNA methylase
MKYMGSKRSMLTNGLGEMIRHRATYSERIVDLFCGAGAIAWFAAEWTKRPVLAVDLQAYSAVLAGAIIERTMPIDSDVLEDEWLGRARRARSRLRLWGRSLALLGCEQKTETLVSRARELCEEASNVGPIWGAYGGHYYSPAQALTFDFLLKYLPQKPMERTVCLAALIASASKCAAAPGHTAQPFQPTERAGVFVREAWALDPIVYCRRNRAELGPRHARVRGRASVADAVEFAQQLQPDDLAIVDPPYSAVQYSRFYHVLETLARGHRVSVEGSGRYPPRAERPQSLFSLKTQPTMALERLLANLSTVGCIVLLTFPSGRCSNGLSGDIVLKIAQASFDVKEKLIYGRFSTLGGNNAHRLSRLRSSELLLLMRPKKRRRAMINGIRLNGTTESESNRDLTS